MKVDHLTKAEKVILLHCLEWICFWWENQEENHFPEMDWKNQDWCEEFSGTWYRCEYGKNDPKCVTYSAGVYYGEIGIDEAFMDYKDLMTGQELSEAIRNDYDIFRKYSGMDADEFLPWWFR